MTIDFTIHFKYVLVLIFRIQFLPVVTSLFFIIVTICDVPYSIECLYLSFSDYEKDLVHPSVVKTAIRSTPLRAISSENIFLVLYSGSQQFMVSWIWQTEGIFRSYDRLFTLVTRKRCCWEKTEDLRKTKMFLFSLLVSSQRNNS